MSDNNAGELKGRMTIDNSGLKTGVEEGKRSIIAGAATIQAECKKIAEAGASTSNAAGQSLATGVGGSASRMERSINAASTAIVAELKIIQQQMAATKTRAEETEKSTSKLGAGLMSIAGVAGTVSPSVGRVVSGLTAVKGVADATGMSFGKAALGVTAIVAPLMAVSAAASFVASAVKDGIALAAANEQTAISYEVLTGSADKASKLMKELREFASSTPFRFDEISQAGKQLLAFGVEAQNITGTMRRLGDVSSALNIPLGDMAYLFGTTRVQGRLFTQDLNQFTSRGIPLIDELAKQFGVAKDQVKKLVEEGQVGFEHVERALVSLTSEGGRFFDMTSRQAQSAAGLWSTLQDTISELKMSLGEGLIEDDTGKQVLKDLISEAEKLKPIFKEAGEALGAALVAAMPAIRELLGTATALLNYVSGQTEKQRINAAKAFDLSGNLDSLPRTAGGLDLLGDLMTPYQKAADDLKNAFTGASRNKHLDSDVRRESEKAVEQLSGVKDVLKEIENLRTRQQAGEIIPQAEIDRAVNRAKDLQKAVVDTQGLATAYGGRQLNTTIYMDAASGVKGLDESERIQKELAGVARASRQNINDARVALTQLPTEKETKEREERDAAQKIEDEKKRKEEDRQKAITESQDAITRIKAKYTDGEDGFFLSDADQKAMEAAQARLKELQSASASAPSSISTSSTAPSTGKSSQSPRSKSDSRIMADTSEEGQDRLAIAAARARGDEQEAERLEIIAQGKRQMASAKSADDALAIERETRRKLTDLEKKHQQEIYDLQTEAEAARLRAAGRAGEADLMEFDARSKRKIDAAKSEAERLLAIEIYRVERLALIQRQADSKTTPPSSPAVPLLSRELPDDPATQRSLNALNQLETRQRVQGKLSRQDQARLDRLRARLGFELHGGGHVDADQSIGSSRESSVDRGFSVGSPGDETGRRAMSDLENRQRVRGGLNRQDQARLDRLRERFGVDAAGMSAAGFANSENRSQTAQMAAAYQEMNRQPQPNYSVTTQAIDIAQLGEVIANKLLPLTRQDLRQALASIRAQNNNNNIGGNL